MTERSTRVRYAALSWLAVAAGLAYLCRNAVGVVESSLRTDLGLTLKESGWCMSAFFWSYAVLQIPAGSLSARFGTRRTMAMFAVGWSLASVAIGMAPGFWTIVMAQLVMGASQAGIFPASINSIGHWMPLKERSFACGVLAAGMQLGAIAASCLTGALVEDVGWRWVFVIFALPGFFWTAAFLLRFYDRPEEDPKVTAEELAIIGSDRPRAAARHDEPAAESSFWDLAQQPAILWLCGQQICRAAGYMFFASWFPTFLQKTRGISVEQSGYLQALVLGGSLAGSLCGGMLTDWVWRRTGSLRMSRSLVGGGFLTLCAGLILSAWFVKSASLAVALLATGALVAGLAGPSALAATIDLGGQRVPQIFGLMNMTGNIAAAVCPVVVGKLFEFTENWDLVLLLFAGVYLLGAMCWAFIRPRGMGKV
jgi:ACS family glucarate transporter-like MFS transporter/ACS family D-galactonate transporter-like MFS transporter